MIARQHAGAVLLKDFNAQWLLAVGLLDGL
jgi:hypothetical protein